MDCALSFSVIRGFSLFLLSLGLQFYCHAERFPPRQTQLWAVDGVSENCTLNLRNAYLDNSMIDSKCHLVQHYCIVIFICSSS